MRHILILFILPLLSCGQTNSSPEKPNEEQIFVHAITEYIHAVKKEHATTYDTLYFGKHPDFPNISLPTKIENTTLLQIEFEEGMKKQKADSSMVYINLFGWAEKTKAEFIFVTFWDRCAHQFDYIINYKYDSTQKDFIIDNSRFDYFLYKKK